MGKTKNAKKSNPVIKGGGTSKGFKVVMEGFVSDGKDEDVLHEMTQKEQALKEAAKESPNNYALRREERKKRCFEIIDSKLPVAVGSGINPNVKIQKADNLSAKLFAFVVSYDVDIVEMVMENPNLVSSLARKGVVDIAIAAGIRGWTPSEIVVHEK